MASHFPGFPSPAIFQNIPYLLFRSSQLSGCFYSKRVPPNGTCHSMNAGSVVGIPLGGGDTQTLPYAKRIYLNLALTGSGGACVQEPPLWNFHNI